jgi:hypothetical protein
MTPDIRVISIVKLCSTHLQITKDCKDTSLHFEIRL